MIMNFVKSTKNIAAIVLTLVLALNFSAYSQTPSGKTGKIGAKDKSEGVKISQDHSLWWFNGETPPVFGGNYNTTATLKVSGVSGAFQWQINAGSDKAVLLLNTVSGSTVMIRSTQASSAASTINKDVVIRIVQGSKTLATFKTVIYRPYILKHTGTTTKPDTTYGYLSLIGYKIYDQFNRLLPDSIPINEEFTTAGIADFVGTTWRGGLGQTIQGSTTTPPKSVAWEDNVGGEASGYVPATVSPTWAPGAATKVQHWTGTWQVGSLTIGQGCQVRASNWGGRTYCIWQKYRGYAHHE